MPVFRLNLTLLACAKCTLSLHARLAGAASIRHSLRPPLDEGDLQSITRAESCRGAAKLCPSSSLSCPAQAGHPVRRGFSIPAALSLEYWVARSSRATTPVSCLTFEKEIRNADGARAPHRTALPIRSSRT